MRWQPSRFRAGEVVEVRSEAEILATLDAEGCLEGMPFMPEMRAFCGRRFTVRAVAHKTCDVARRTLRNRKLSRAVHLAGAHCDGSAHDGCGADCSLFWKDAWLRRPAEGPAPVAGPPAVTHERLVQLTRRSAGPADPEPVYSCQVTRLFDATAPLAWWNPRQYLLDVRTGNHRAGHALRVLVVAAVRWLRDRTPVGYRVLDGLYRAIHAACFGRDLPDFAGTVPKGVRTPVAGGGLAPGDRVRIRPKAEVERTLDVEGKNRGMRFDVEMSPFCGMETRVRKEVTRLINEGTGRMMVTKTPSFILEGTACRADYSACRLLCPRAIPSYWREAWLERLGPADGGPSA